MAQSKETKAALRKARAEHKAAVLAEQERAEAQSASAYWRGREEGARLALLATADVLLSPPWGAANTIPEDRERLRIFILDRAAGRNLWWLP